MLGSDMAALRSIIILELRLDEDALVYDLESDCSEEGNQVVLLAVGEVGCALGVLDDGEWVGGICENVINIVTESRIIDETRGVVNFILLNQGVNLLLVEL